MKPGPMLDYARTRFVQFLVDLVDNESTTSGHGEDIVNLVRHIDKNKPFSKSTTNQTSEIRSLQQQMGVNNLPKGSFTPDAATYGAIVQCNTYGNA